MSAKKPKQSIWQECSTCKLKVLRVNSGKHSDLCTPVFPCIQNNVLFTVLSRAPSTSEISKLSIVNNGNNIRLSSSMLFLSLELIRECQLKTFGWVIVNNKTEEGGHDPGIALRVWPLSNPSNNAFVCHMTEESLLVNGTLKTTGDGVITVQNFIPGRLVLEGTCAREVTLQLTDISTVDGISFNKTRFIETFLSTFQGRLVTKGNQFCMRYYLDVVPFRIENVVVDECDLETSKEAESQLVEKLEAMQLQSEQHKPSLVDVAKSSHFNLSVYAEITRETVVNVITCDGNVRESLEKFQLVTLEDVGGLDAVVSDLCASINYSLKPYLEDMFVSKGFILHGHSGTGKTLLVQAMCSHFKLHLVAFEEFTQLSMEGSKRTASSCNSLTQAFSEACAKQPAAVIIENLEVLASKNPTMGSETKSSLAATLRNQIQLLSKTDKIIVIATCTDVEQLDLSLRSPHIFAKEIELPVPSALQRKDILCKLIKKLNHNLTEDEILEISSSTHGYVGADLEGLCIQATKLAFEQSTLISVNHMKESMKFVKPSAMKSIFVDVPNVKWDDIGGQEDLKFKLKQSIEWPLKHPEAFKRLGITAPKGVLMYGPPGCSKTMVAKAIATESGLNFISVKSSELFSKWVGESEKAVQGIFRKARQVAPCVVFFDEVDSLCGERGSTSGSSNVHERVLAQLLVEIDGIEPLKDVTIVAATNRPDIIDHALLRPGRLDRIVYVPLPDENTREGIFRIKTKKMPVNECVKIDTLVKLTDGYSGAEITAVCHEAALKALEENINATDINENHFKLALDIVKPRISKEQIQFYQNYQLNKKK